MFEVEDGYNVHEKNSNIAFKLSSSPSSGIDEHWRNVYADITSPASRSINEGMAGDLSSWLAITSQLPLAVNTTGDFSLARLFEQTGQVVYTVGTLDEPALTCQARPQDGDFR